MSSIKALSTISMMTMETVSEAKASRRDVRSATNERSRGSGSGNPHLL